MVRSIVTIGLLTLVGVLIPLGLQGLGLEPRAMWGCALAVVLDLFHCT
jgi:hypothetical protein